MDTWNRRQFLGVSGAAAASVAFASPVTAAGPTIGVGFIGVGNRGSVHLGNMLKIAGVQVRAICDIKPEHLKRAQDTVVSGGQPEPWGTADWKKLLERDDIQAVVSALPCDLHARCYLDVLAAGKDLYGEKPMCITIPDLNTVVAAAKKSDRIVQIGFQRRADPRFIEPMALIHKGELGRLVEGRIMWSNAWGPLYDWFGKRERSGDWMVEQACHNWDVMNWANQGVPVRAMGLGHDDLFREQQPDRNVHDYYSAVVQYPNGCIVNILHSWVPGKALNNEYTQLIGTQASMDFNAGLISDRSTANPNRRAYSYQGTIDNSLMAQEAFINSVRTRKPPVASVEEGRNAALSCLLVREAVYRKSVVTMEEILAKAG
jgi:myo-inositol 2-dehydrogenase / D-chiro-inositol 1-dehydrogenase